MIKRKRRVWPPWLVVIGALVACGVGGMLVLAGVVNTAAKPATVTTMPVPKAIAPAGTPAAKDDSDPIQSLKDQGIFTAGDYEVGKKSNPNAGTIAPGTYVVATPDDCYWSRVNSFDGQLGSVIANGNVSKDQIVHVTVKKTDKGVSMKGNCIMGRKGTS